MRVFMYWNLHRECWSLKALEGQNKGRVIAHASAVDLVGCSFKVSESGRQRVLRERRKNVHAGVVGTVRAYLGVRTSAGELQQVAQGTPVTYNPYKGPTFTTADAARVPVSRAESVRAIGRHVVAVGI